MTDNTPAKKPGPRPGPRPGAMPRRPAATAGKPVAPAAPRKSNPAEWGRVDADGTVWVRTADGERQVGSWQAGTPEEGLAHYGARFDDLATEIELLEARIQSHPEEAATVRASAEELKGQLPDAAVVGDIAALDKRLGAVLSHADQAGEKAKADKAERRAAAIAQKEKLAAEAEDIAENSEEWKVAGDRIREILTEWKQIRGIDRKTDDLLWKRYSRARDAFNRRRGSHFADLDRNRAAARRAKEALIEEAEALQHSTDWGETAAAYRDLMNRWKEAGRAPREVDDKLWKRFKGAQDTFFAARNAVNAERDKEFEANAEAKEALLAEYDERIRPDKDLDHARAELRKLQERWEEIGFVPRGRVREFEDKIGKLEKRVSEAADSQWRRTDPEAMARVQQFADRAAEFEAKAAEFEAAGKAKKAEDARAQAAQWREWADAAERALEEM
ncbi:MAG TPA: DUF349 domain-containing protein [Corynebacterium xerosis]|uniref:DUF349 domain-containing protein n=1 Tax=Corynebacterium xerosis TaxID=1725 RepID=UPI001DE98EFE|nr:DUF349 domain-containing protein [Corynebacterium xerosis]HJG57733.1 DUF349 domain-containing protein [Corynebacterium xerosis]